MKLPVYNCLIDENPDDESGIYAVSFVDEPANETDFVALKKQPREEHLSMDSQKQILTGVVLRPLQLIYRNTPQMGEHYIRFSAEQIEKISHKMMRSGIALHNTTHQHRQPLEGNYLIELWIVEDPRNDKAAALGFRDLPQGTLMCSYKIEDREYWENEVISGNVKGFSLEGFFFQQEMKRHDKSNINNQTNMNRKNKTTLLSKIAKLFLDIEDVRKNDVSQSGTAYLAFTLADGKEMLVDADGFATLGGKQMPAGEHPLADGNTLVVDDEGQFVETKETSEVQADPEAATAPQTLARKMNRIRKSRNGQETEIEDATPSSDLEALHARVEELELKLSDFESRMEEIFKAAEKAETEIENLRRQTPGALPLVHSRRGGSIAAEAPHTERMAVSLTTQMQRRK